MENETNQQPPSRLRPWIAPAWFLLGVLVGVIGFAVFGLLAPTKSPGTQVAGESVSTQAMRQAARDGTLDAIATLQAGGPAQPSGDAAGTPVASAASFTLRDANRLGSQTAPVTIVEFSDFQ
jgi:hypothetical protein